MYVASLLNTQHPDAASFGAIGTAEKSFDIIRICLLYELKKRMKIYS